MNSLSHQLTPREAREAFHVILLDELGTRLEHDLWTVKGGVNLRVFFDSVRYSEDIDLDVLPIKRQAVRNQLRQILKSEQLMRRLRSIGIQDLRRGEKEISKDTETTLRFNRQVVVGGVPHSTTVEISLRDADSRDEREVAPVHSRFSDNYLGKGRTVVATHYTHRSALAQKLSALANRTAVQARDVFDICWLLRTPLSAADMAHVAVRVGEETLVRAGQRAAEIRYEEYRDNVLEYLDPSDATPYTGMDAWLAQQLQVVDLVADLRQALVAADSEFDAGKDAEP